MALVLTDRVKETSVTSGTGTITLGGAFGGFQTFLAGIGNGNTTYYTIENGTSFEVGIGTYTSSSNTLSRDTVLSSSGGGDTKIDLTGVSYVFCTYPASKAVFLDEEGKTNLPVGLTIASGLEVSNRLDALGDLGVSGLLTLKRDSAGNFFHAYVDDSNDKTIALYHDGTVSPDWKLGLKDSPNNSGDPPTYAYVYAGDGSIGLYSNSLNSINLTHGGGFNIVNKGDTVFSATSSAGTSIVNFTASSPGLIIKAATSQSANIQEWQNSAGTVLSCVTDDGKFGIGTDAPDYTLDVAGNIGVNEYIRHNGDSHTYMRFRGDQIDFVAGNVTMLTLDETSQDIVKINDGGNDVDFQVEGENDSNLIRTDAENDRVGIGTDSPSYLLDVRGSGSFETLRFSDGTTQISAGLAASSGSLIDQNSLDIVSVSGLTTGGLDALPHGSGDYFLGEIRSNSASGTINASDLLVVSGIAASVGSALPVASGGKITYNLNEIRTNSASGTTNATNITANTSLVHASGNFLLDKIIVNENSGITRNAHATSNENRINSSGNALLTKITANASSGIERDTSISNNTLSINSSGNMLLDEVKANSASGLVISGIAAAGGSSLPYSSGDFFLNEIIANSASGLVISGIASAGGSSLPYSSGDFFLTEIRSNSASGNSNLTEIRANSASGVTNTNLVHSSGDFLLGEITVNSASGASISGYAQGYANMKVANLIDSAPAALDTLNELAAAINDDANISTTLTSLITANTTEIRANSASGVSNTNLVNASGDFLLGEIQTNSASGSSNLTEVRANSASGNFNLTEIRANSASGVTNVSSINNSGVFWLGEIQTNSASGAANLTEIRANSASGNFNLTEIRANSASGAANLTEIRANSASGTVNVNAINASGDFLLNEITTNSASGNFSAGSGIELHGKAFQAAVSGANLLATNTPTDNYVPSYDIDTGKFTWVENAGGGGGGGSMTSVKSNGSAVGGSDIVTLDFSSDFGVAETPDTEINITIGTLNQNTTGSAATLTTARAIALAGDVTGTANFDGSAGISITSTIANDAVTYAKMQDTSADNRLLGAATAGTIGEVQVATAMIADDAVTYAKMQHTGTANRVLGAASAGVIGEVQVATAMIANDAVDGTKIADDAIDSEHYADGSIDTAHIADDQVTYAKIQNVSATDRILGRDSSGAGVIEEITPANLRTMINVEDGATADQTKSDIDSLAITTVGTLAAGDATAIVSAASTTAAGKVELATTAETTTGTDTARAVTPDGLKDGYQGSTNVTTLGTIATGTWQGTAIAHAYIGDDAIDGDNIADDSVNSEHYVDGSIDTAHIGDDQVTYAKVQNVSATSRVLGRITSGAGVIEELTGANIVSIIGTLNQDTTGSAATLTTARNINGVAFDGSANITVTAAGSTLSDTVPVSKGGTGATSFADKAVLITQDTGTDTVAAAAMSTNGQLLIGGTSGPAVATLTEGSNITITNADGAITIAAAGGGSVDIDALDALGGTSLHQTQDHFMFSDNGTEKKITFSNLQDAIFSDISGDGTVAAGGALTIADDVIDSAELADACSAVTSFTAPLVKGSTSIQTPLIEYTDGDDAISIADGGAVTFAQSINQAHQAGALASNSLSFDCSKSNYFEVAINAQVDDITFTNATAGQRIILLITNSTSSAHLSDSNGWDTITINTNSGADILWAGGIEPTLTASGKDMYGIVFTSTVTTAYGFIIGQDIKA